MSERRRPSPTAQEIDRMAQNISYRMGRDRSMKSYQKALGDYFGNSHFEKQWEPRLRGSIQHRQPKEFEKAGGRDREQDLKSTAPVVTKDKKRYRKLGAQNADLIGVDVTKDSKPSKSKRSRPEVPRSEFKLIGKTRQRTVFIRPAKITRSYKGRKVEVAVFRNRIGQFARRNK